MYPLAQTHNKKAYLLATGQVTSYVSGDDGDLELGVIKSYTVLTGGQYSDTTNIAINGKTDAHSNACVVDNNTGKMWSRTASGSVGPTSNGKLPWTTNANGEGIFTYCAAANAAALAGHSDWRVPNQKEVESLMTQEAASGIPNSTAFPTISVDIWASTTTPNDTTKANCTSWATGRFTSLTKTDATVDRCLLVRG